MEIERFEEIMNMSDEELENVSEEEYDEYMDMQYEVDTTTGWQSALQCFHTVALVEGRRDLIDMLQNMLKDEKQLEFLGNFFRSCYNIGCFHTRGERKDRMNQYRALKAQITPQD